MVSPFKEPKKGNWTINYALDDAFNLDLSLKSEIRYKRHMCLLSCNKYLQYLNDSELPINIDNYNKKTVVLLNGEIRQCHLFINWARRISRIAYIYIYTDKITFQKLNIQYRKLLEQYSTDIAFSEDDEIYKETLLEKEKDFQINMHQWLKLKEASRRWSEEWHSKNIKTIFRMRSDVAFLNPYILENSIKNGFEGNIFPGKMLARSDMFYAFHINDLKILSSFFNSIFPYYCGSDWIKYSYIPLDPSLILDSRGGTRIEWCKFPIKYISKQPDKYNFFDFIAKSFDKLVLDYKEYSPNENLDANEREKLFGPLSSTREDIRDSYFEPEKYFAHFLAKNKITSASHNQLFIGPLKNFDYLNVELSK